MIYILLILASLVTSHSSNLVRVTLVQQQVCHQERDQVICRCYQEQDTLTQMPAYLGIRMQGFLMHSNNLEVSSLVVESCDDLILNLDLRGLNLSSINTVIRDSKIVMLETILADYRESFAQTYNLTLYKVKNATLSGINLVSSVMIRATNLGQLQILDCSFSSLPRSGLLVTGVSSFQVTGCVFSAIQSKSVIVRQTREFIMMDNQFGVSTPGLDILSYSDSVSYVNILCNRLLGSPVSPDCVTEVTPVTRVTTAYITNTNQDTDNDWMVTVSGSLLIIAILLYTGYMTYTHRGVLSNIKSDLVSQIMNGRPGAGAGVADLEQEFLSPANNTKSRIPCPPPIPTSSTSNMSVKDTKTSSIAISETENGSKTVSATNPAANGGSGSVLSTPIWLQEIKSNEIFNKRKIVSGYDEEAEDENRDIDEDEYPDVKILHKTIDRNLLSKKEYVY